jgi:hypothetical protein
MLSPAEAGIFTNHSACNQFWPLCSPPNACQKLTGRCMIIGEEILQLSDLLSSP